MKGFLKGLLLGVIGILSTLTLAHAETRVSTAHTRLELISDVLALAPGESATLGVVITPEAHWHTYWRFAGEVGLPTRLTCTLPESVHAGDIEWPVPTRFETGGLVSYGFDTAHTLLIPVQVSPTMTGTLPISVHAKWLVCEAQCVPEEADLSIELKLGTRIPSPDAARILAAKRAMPERIMGRATSHYDGRTWWGQVEGEARLDPLEFYPAQKSPLQRAATPEVRVVGKTWSVWWPVTEGAEWGTDPLAGLFVDRAAGRAWLVSFPVSAGEVPPISKVNESAPSESRSRWGIWGLAFLGGLLLNLMPCVLPVLSLKVVALIREHPSPAEAARQGLAFLLGVLVSFWILVAALLALRAAGHWVGWGFQLQSPVVVTVLALLFTLLALNFAGRFEWGEGIQRWAGDLSLYRSHSHLLNSFLVGVLTTIVATPCTAPFLGAGIGYTLTQSNVEVFLTFTAMALGVALPVTLATLSPRVLALLPRPGAWMERFKHLLALPMVLTVLWLIWVLMVQKGAILAFVVALGLILLTFLLSVGSRVPATLKKTLLPLLCVGILLAPVIVTGKFERSTRGQWQPYSDTALLEARNSGHPVFVDFTAAWCLSCQVNLRTTLQNPEVLRAFEKHGVVLLEADWTDSDPLITRALERLHRNALPVYALYPALGSTPMLLPEVLTPRIVLDALATLP